jgi:hypothetical protein
LKLSDDLGEGRWVTLNEGKRVFIKTDGTIVDDDPKFSGRNIKDVIAEGKAKKKPKIEGGGRDRSGDEYFEGQDGVDDRGEPEDEDAASMLEALENATLPEERDHDAWKTQPVEKLGMTDLANAVEYGTPERAAEAQAEIDKRDDWTQEQWQQWEQSTFGDAGTEQLGVDPYAAPAVAWPVVPGYTDDEEAIVDNFGIDIRGSVEDNSDVDLLEMADDERASIVAAARSVGNEDLAKWIEGAGSYDDVDDAFNEWTDEQLLNERQSMSEGNSEYSFNEAQEQALGDEIERRGLNDQSTKFDEDDDDDDDGGAGVPLTDVDPDQGPTPTEMKLMREMSDSDLRDIAAGPDNDLSKFAKEQLAERGLDQNETPQDEVQRNLNTLQQRADAGGVDPDTTAQVREMSNEDLLHAYDESVDEELSRAVEAEMKRRGMEEVFDDPSDVAQSAQSPVTSGDGTQVPSSLEDARRMIQQDGVDPYKVYSAAVTSGNASLAAEIADRFEGSDIEPPQSLADARRLVEVEGRDPYDVLAVAGSWDLQEQIADHFGISADGDGDDGSEYGDDDDDYQDSSSFGLANINDQDFDSLGVDALTVEDSPRLVGISDVVPKDDVLITVDPEENPGVVGLHVDNDQMYMVRYLHPEEGYIENSEFTAKTTGTGLGSKVFSAQVEEAAASGYREIRTFAMRSSGYNGYWTWALFGYNAPLSEIFYESSVTKEGDVVYNALKKLGVDPVNGSLHDIMSTQEGRDWWQANGKSFNGVFDLSEDSKHREILNGYMAGRKARGR